MSMSSVRVCCLGPEAEEARRINDMIERQFRRDGKASLREFKLLLLGPKNDERAGKDFILDMFLSVNPYEKSMIYSHFTCATDTDNIRFVFSAMKHQIMSRTMEEFKLI